MRKKLLVSLYNDHDEIKGYQYLLTKWNKNSNFPEVDFQRQNLASIETQNEITKIDKQKLYKSDALLILVGRQTIENSYWVGWQITTAAQLHKPILIYKLRSSYLSPYEVYDFNVRWINDFSYDEIRNAFH